MLEYTGYICAFLAIGGSLIELLFALSLRSRVKNWPGKKPEHYPQLTIFSPQRGKIDSRNIDALLGQNYPGIWEVIFVTTQDDASLSQLQKYSKKYKNVKIVIADDVVQFAGKQGIHRSQKNNNIVSAIKASSPETEVYVLVDADTCPFRNWLSNLITPLAGGDSELGAVTSARIYLPGKGLASWVQALWILNSAPFLGGKNGYIWGGGMAIPKAVFEKAKLISQLNGQGKGSITSDDNSINMALLRQGYETLFVPDCIVPRYPSDIKETWGDVVGFTNRQILNFFWTNRSQWLFSSLIMKIRMPLVLCALAVSWWYPFSSLALLSPLIDVVYSFMTKNTLLNSTQREELNVKLNFWAVFLPMLTQILGTINFISVPFYRSMRWGGIEYTRRSVVGYTGDFSWRVK
jgi:cellulose synthase/poly-beta-1,6-N-acetylglucosamine synthase-like glycosyltransferase